MHETDQFIRDALAAGARGYVLKADAGKYLIEGVEALSKHKPFFTSKASESLLDGFLESRLTPVENNVLTDREREIVQLLAEGKANKEIAATLCISIKTVESHRSAIMRKLKINSIVDLVRYAIRNNWSKA
jgi:DNA-binding NarL/FixJ family response regulator